MYSYLYGKIAELSINKCVIDVNGVGYLCNISLNTYSQLKNHQIGTDVKLYQYLNVREDELSLFGFYTVDEKNLFMKFLQVEGIGPKKAIEIFNFGTPQDFINAIENQDSGFFVKVKGIGPKQAQKIILELTGKLTDIISKNRSKAVELIEGLQSLGFSRKEIENTIDNLKNKSNINIDGLEFEEAFKLILSNLSRYK